MTDRGSHSYDDTLEHSLQKTQNARAIRLHHTCTSCRHCTTTRPCMLEPVLLHIQATVLHIYDRKRINISHDLALKKNVTFPLSPPQPPIPILTRTPIHPVRGTKCEVRNVPPPDLEKKKKKKMRRENEKFNMKIHTTPFPNNPTQSFNFSLTPNIRPTRRINVLL